MKISYEMNPPRILDGSFNHERLKQDIEKFYNKVDLVKDFADSIHVTDSVLGIPRVSSISIAREIKGKIRCSIRVRDRNFAALLQLVCDAVIFGIDGLLIVKGDKPKHSSIDSGLKPGIVIKELNKLGFKDHIKLYLSIPCNAKRTVIEKKIESEPYGLITQTINSIEGLERIVDLAKAHGVSVLPCIMVPCQKNKRSAEMIGLDWSSYEKDPDSFIKRAYDICGEVLMTSPMSFEDGLEMLRRLSKW